MNEHPINRRLLLEGSTASLVAILLAGCGGSSAKLPPVSTGTATTSTGPTNTATAGVAADVPGPPAQGGKRGGRLVNVWDEEGSTYDPAVAYSGTGWDAIADLLNAALYAYSEAGEPLPNAAAAAPTVSADGLVYTIPLRPGVTFHNGRAVVAADYKYAWERVLNPKLESWASSYMMSIAGAQELFDRKAKELTGVRAVDDATLEVTLKEADVTFLYLLTQPFTAAVPREEVVKLGNEGFAKSPTGTGPFRLVSYDPQGQKATFQRFDGYFWEGLPYLDEVEFRWGIDQNAQLLMLQRNQADVLGYGLTTRSLQRINATSSLQPFLYSQPLYACRWVALEQRRNKALANPLVREALNWATNRDQLQRVTAGEADGWGAPFPKAMLQSRTFTPYTYDPEKAKSLLAQSGVGDLSATLWVTSSPEPELGQVLQQQWKDAGFTLKLKQASTDAVTELINKGGCDAWISTYWGIYPTALDVVKLYWESDGTWNQYGFKNADVDRLAKQARATTDHAAREAILAQIEELVAKDAGGVFIENVNWNLGVNLPRLKNFHYSGVFGTYYDRVWVDA
jgi:peptide/nickel transport system substrate-binding protein